MRVAIEILGQELIVEYVAKITSHGAPATGPSYSSGGEPAEPMEFEIEILGVTFPKQHADVPDPIIPEWLSDLIMSHLHERDDVYEVVQQSDDYDYDD